ncbi:hypothetical protein ACPPVO_11750 [Dactylosporangium sp. McL0621]|uniref:hypothetical protein n=1 Tax=Dactylosporangium sp. McL0621 TaxID=3415678 RepID=UPI003CEB624C
MPQPPAVPQPAPPIQPPAAPQWVPPAVPQPAPPAPPRAVHQPAPPAPAGFYPPPPPPRSRNPLLIPGVIFGIVALLLVGGVIVYAFAGGDDKPEDQGLTGGTNPVVAASDSATADEPSPTPTGPLGGLPGPSASGTASPSATAVPCILGVFLEEQHNEQVTVLNTGTFPFTGSGAYHRYNESGRVVIDYGDGMHLRGSNGSTQFEYIFEGFISYQFKYDGSTVTYSSPRPDGTETFIRNGHVDYKGKLEARVPQPMKVNCGPVAMSLSNQIYTLQLKRTSKAP